MNKYIETLDSLIKTKRAKKKKEPSLQDKEAFRNAWIGLAVESNFNLSAEQFLYEGFGFCGATPFYSYLLKTENKLATLSALFRGKFYGKDSNVTFRLITHLLALMLNDDSPQKLLAILIRHFTGACVNKDNKPLGTADKTINKYFFAELSSDATLCPLANIGAEPAVIAKFVSIISPVLASVEQNNTPKNDGFAKNLKKIREWLAAYDDTNKTPSDKVNDQSNTVVAENKNDAELKDNSKDTKPEDTMSSELIGKLIETASAIKAELDSRKKRITDLEDELKNANTKLSNACQEISGQRLFIAELQGKIYADKNKIAALEQDAEQAKILIAKKDAAIADGKKMLEIRTLNQGKQKNELLQKLAAQIKVEYSDFMPVQNDPMSSDLCAIYKQQLLNIFEILEKGGMKIK